MKKVLFKKMLTIMMAFFIVVGLMPAMNDSVYADEGPVAKVTSNDGEFTKKCDTMLDVIIFITSHEGGTINLNRDWDYQDNGTTWTGPFIIGGGETVTINLNGHIMNRHLAGDVESSSAVSDGCLFHVREGSTLIINGGKDASDASITTWHMGRTSQGIWMTEDDFGSIEYGGGMLAGGYNSDGGGCITADAGANVTLNNVTLAGNISSYGGGAVYLGGSNSNPSHLQVNNSKLEYNKSISSHGGAICSDYGYVTINKGSSISHNKATGSYYGGGIYANANLEVSLIIEGTVINGEKSIQINDNTADQGGGIYLNYGEKSIIRNTNIEDNNAVNLDSDATRSLVSIGSGGGIFVNEDDFFIANCIVKNNKASGDGGGIYCGKTFCYTTRCSITNNYCKVEGGGVCVANTSNTIDNCTIQDNSCTVSGGGICLKKSPLYASNVLTLSGNVIVDDNASLRNNQQYRDNLYIANSKSNLDLGYLPTLNVDNLSLGSNIGITATTGSTRYITDATSCNPCCLFSDQDSIYCISKATDSDKIYIKKRVADDPYNLTAITSTNTIKDQHKSGETVTINAATPTGKIFDHWEISGLSSGVNAPAMPTTAVGTFIMPASNFTATAVYKDKISSASLTIAAPAGGTDLTESAATNLTGINATTGIVWTDSDGNKVSGKAAYNTAYTATVTLTKDEANKVEFTSPFTAGVNGNAAAGTCTYSPVDGSVVITYTFAATPKAKLTAQPANPADISVYTGKTKDDVIAMLPSAIAIQTEDGTKMASVKWASDSFNSNQAAGYTFTGTLDLNTLNVDPDTVNNYTDIVTTIVTVLSKQKAATPTVTSDNPATSTQEQTVKLATATPGATIMYKLQTNDVPTSDNYTAYTSDGIKLAVPTEGPTNVYKITAYTVSTDSGIMDNSAQVTFTYVISKPISTCNVKITCSDTRSYGEGETPWTATVSTQYANGSNVILTAPNYESKVFDHWETVSGTTGITDTNKVNRTITIAGLQGDVELKAIYRDTVSSVALTITEPSIGTDLAASADTGLTGTNATPGIVWTDAANKVSGKAAYNTAYTATVTLTNDKANNVEFSSTTASPFTATVNGKTAACTYYPADGSIVITYTFAATPKAKLTAQPENPAGISVYIGKTKDAVIAMLPSAIAVQTEDGTKPANVTWDSAAYDSSKPGNYTFTGTLDLTELNNDKNTYSNTVSTTVTVLSKQLAASPTVTSGNPATSTQAQTVKLATATTGATIKYTVSENNGTDTASADYTNAGILLKAPYEGQTTVYKITAYTVSTDSGSMDDSAPVTFTYVISTPMPKYTVTFTGSDTGIYVNGATPWSVTRTADYTKGSNVTLTAPQDNDNDFADEVFDHWEVVSGTASLDAAALNKRTITISNLQGAVELKAIYNPVVKTIDLTLTPPEAGKQLSTAATKCIVTVTNPHDVTSLISIAWSPAASTAAYSTVYTAAVKLDKDIINQYAPNLKFFFADNITINVNGNTATGTLVGNGSDAIIYIPFAKTDTKLLSISQPADIYAANGTEASVVQGKLPSEVSIRTTDETVKTASVTWEKVSYDKTKVTGQDITVNGTVTIPDTVKNLDSISKSVSLTVHFGAAEQAERPLSSLKSGSYTGTQEIKLTSRTEGAKIYYSTDGSEPNKLYTAPITISGSATVNAMSKKSGYRDSDVESFSYTVTQPFNYTPPTPERKAPQIILLKAVSGKTSVKLTWTAVDGATKYVIYGGRCGAGSKYAKLKTVSADAVSCTFQDLKAHRSYKYYVVAYGDTDRLCTSRTTHVVVVSSYTDRYNATKVTAADADVSLTAGNSAQIEAKVYTLSGKALFGEGHCPIIRFVTADSSIATVSKTGEITAVSEGTTTIYVLAPNGIRTAVKVTVEH